MNRYIKRPAFMLEAAQTGRGYNIWLEILIFVAVFLVGSIGTSLVAGIAYAFYLFFGTDVLTAGPEAIFTLTESTMNTVFMPISLFATVITIIIAILYCRVLEKRKLRTMGFVKQGAVKEYLLGMLVGFVMFSVAVAICVLTGSAKFAGLSSDISFGLIAVYFVGFLIQGMSEEVLLRGYFMVSCSRKNKLFWAVLVNSLFFGVLHLGNANVSILAVINIVLFGVFASVYMLKRGSIWGVAAVHSIWNFVQGNLYGIKVSGMDEMETIFSVQPYKSGSLINGGDFGLEGGLGVTAVLVVGILLVIFIGKKEGKSVHE